MKPAKRKPDDMRHAGMRLQGVTVVLLAFLPAFVAQGQQPPYKNAALPVDERVNDLLSRMTLEEKFRQLFMVSGDLSDGEEKYLRGICGIQMSARGHGRAASEQMIDRSFQGAAAASAEKNNAAQRFFVEKTRLGIPIIPFDEALHGLVREGATAFPASIALAATWDERLMNDVAGAIADETRSRGIRQILSPVVNVATDPRWGRVEETYGEDPYLSSVMGTAFVSQFERRGVVTTPKHFVANHGDGGRDSYPAYWNDRLLEETYFPPFKACVMLGGSRSIMSSYNSVDGRPCTADPWLLNRKLREEWGFRGFVVSDAGAVGGINDLHRTSADYEESAKQAIENGLDVLLQTSVDQFPLFFDRALAHPTIDQRAVDGAVARVLRVKFQLGLFDHPYVDPDSAAALNDSPAHRELARRASRESIVLLKNTGGLLPLRKDVGSIAVIGPDAAVARLGGYSGPGVRNVSILEGIRERLGSSTRIAYEEGCTREVNDVVVI
ncbi:MAG TPA: glycoside hydrolase family 3 protein, partial [Bacteroidota bacterium]|nr:glycoside hydrolase family 3 protein [Bacteroidota bacterium]